MKMMIYKRNYRKCHKDWWIGIRINISNKSIETKEIMKQIWVVTLTKISKII